jgi:succinate-acetate transporter protein
VQPEYRQHLRQQERADSAPAVLQPRVFLRPIGNPLPLGFLGLTVATLSLAALNLGWVPTAEQHSIAIVLVAFAFPTQLIATVFGFLARDAVVASGIGVQAASWLTIGLLLLTSPPGHKNPALSFFLFVAAAALLSSVLVAVQAKVVPALVMAGTAARFSLTGVAERFGSTFWAHVSGWEGIGLACLALYTAVAIDLESSKRKPVLPLLRHGHGLRAVRGSAYDQIDGVEHEAGVREEL